MPDNRPDIDDIDDIVDIEAIDEAQLHDLWQRISRSSTWEQLVYRETEIDQVWRLVENRPEDVRLTERKLGRLRASIMQIHDLVGVDHKPAEAAKLLKSVLTD